MAKKKVKRKTAKAKKTKKRVKQKVGRVRSRSRTKAKGDWLVDHKDCNRWLDSLAGRKVDLAFADPPYNIGHKGYDGYDDKLKPEAYVAWCLEWMSRIRKSLKKTGSFWLAIGDEFVSELDVGAKNLGFYKRGHCIWYYTFGVACSKNFSRSHTHFLYYTMQKGKFTFNKDDSNLRVPSARQLVYNDKRQNPKGKLPDNTWILSPVDLQSAFVHHGKDTEWIDTWIESRIAGTFGDRIHRGEYGERQVVPQLPEKILDRIILACSNPGDTVIDPFAGTGTTGASAIALGRHFLGCDASRQCVSTTKRRLESTKVR